MILYLMIALVSILLVYQTEPVQDNSIKIKYQNSRLQLKNQTICYLIFSILFLFSAIRYGVGNDYGQYVTTFHEISVGGYVVTEPGFNLIVKAVYFLCGTEAYQVVFAIFGFATIAVFMFSMWKYSKDFKQAFFLFMMLGLYFQTYNTMRYYLALAIVMYSMHLVLEKKWISFCLIILATSLIHKSVLIVIPLFFLASIRWKKIPLIIAIAFSGIALVFHNFFLKLALYLYPSYRNTIYLNGGTSPVSIMRCILIAVLAFVYYKNCIKEDKELTFYMKLNILALIVYLFFFFLPVITRIGYYLTVSHLLFLPALISKIPEEKQKKWIKIGIGIAALIYFLIFLKNATAGGVALLPYQTWIFLENK